MAYDTNIFTRTRGRLAAGVAAAVITAAALATPGVAEAQGRGRASGKVPPGHLPRAGECRVWYEGRPPGRQPAPTSCSRAEAEASRSGARVLYGGDRRSDRYDGDDRYERDDRDERDDRTRTRDQDRDRDRDGYPDDYPRGTSSSLPEMVWGVLTGRRSSESLPWVGNDARSRYVDANRDGRPEVVTWTDRNGRVMQRWVDANRDGRADRVEVYRDGRVARVIR